MDEGLSVFQQSVPKASGWAEGLTPSPLHGNRRQLEPGLGPWLTPTLLLPSPGDQVCCGHCSPNLENNFPLVGYCGLLYLEQSC